MALRILLADESATIKKVIELSLQDYAVELRIVNLGVDVLEVAKSFQPDIILADILLQKRSGYEVCHEIKSTPETKNIPVVILWSGFMELDQAKLQVVGADDTLEKPFDSETLRGIINKLVPQSGQSNPILEHIQVPDIPAPADFTQVKSLDDINQQLEEEQEPSDSPSLNVIANENSEKESEWNMDSFDGLPDLEFPDEDTEENSEIDPEEDDFSHFEIKTPNISQEVKPDTVIDFPDEDGDNQWVNQSLGKFQLDLPEEDDSLEELEGLDVPDIDMEISDANFLWNTESETSSQEPTDSTEQATEDHQEHLPEEEPVTVAEESEHLAPEGFNFNDVPSLDSFSDAEHNTSTKLEVTPSPIGTHPTVEEIAIAPEIDLEDISEPAIEIEHNHELGIEVVPPEEGNTSPAMPITNKPASENQISDILNSKEFETMVKSMVEQKLGEMVEKLIPELAKSSIENEIKRLLDEPYKE